VRVRKGVAREFVDFLYGKMLAHTPLRGVLADGDGHALLVQMLAHEVIGCLQNDLIKLDTVLIVCPCVIRTIALSEIGAE
jgi:hypothetical protein